MQHVLKRQMPVLFQQSRCHPSISQKLLTWPFVLGGDHAACGPFSIASVAAADATSAGPAAQSRILPHGLPGKPGLSAASSPSQLNAPFTEEKPRLGGGSSQLLRRPGHLSGAGRGSQPHGQDSAAFEPVSITRLLSQSHPGAFELGMTRLALPAFPPPGSPKTLVAANTHAGGAALFIQRTQKFHLKSTRSFSSSSHFFCSVVPHHLPHTTHNLSAGSHRTLFSFHVPHSVVSHNSLHLHGKSFRSKNLNCSVF